MVDSMRVCICIPARYESERLPGKPLIDIHGKTLIHRVLEQCKQSKWADHVVVLTDDDRILQEVHSQGFDGEMTGKHHRSGTERMIEYVDRSDFDYYLNLQGDEPLVTGPQIDHIILRLVRGSGKIVTPVTPAQSSEELFNYARVKVVFDQESNALYFSRQAIPSHRDLPYEQWLENAAYFIHTGIYGFSRSDLGIIAGLDEQALEKAEKLEQLRWLECGLKIECLVMADWKLFSVDTEADLQRIRSVLKIKA